MTVEWTDTAIRNLTAIHDFIAQDSPFYARKMVDRLTRRSEQIATFPRSGREVPEIEDESIREVQEGPYRLIYRILPNRIDVLTVLHGARRFSLEPPEN